MDPSLQPRAINLYEKITSNPIGELFLIPSLLKFYIGNFMFLFCQSDVNSKTCVYEINYAYLKRSSLICNSSYVCM